MKRKSREGTKSASKSARSNIIDESTKKRAKQAKGAKKITGSKSASAAKGRAVAYDDGQPFNLQDVDQDHQSYRIDRRGDNRRDGTERASRTTKGQII